MNHRLVISHSDCKLDRISQYLSDAEEIFWLYLGKSNEKRRKLEGAFGKRLQRIDIAYLHDEVAKEIRDEYTRWVDDLNSMYGRDIRWWFGIISSRNVFMSSLFQNCCYLEILDRLFESGITMNLVIVESNGMAEAVKKWASTKKLQVKISRFGLKGHIYDLYILPALRCGFAIIRVLLRFITFKSLKLLFAAGGKRPIPIKKDYVIISTFLHDNCLTDEGQFQDRYFPHLHEYYSSKGLDVLVHPILHGFRYNYVNVYRKILKSEKCFILGEDCLKLRDFLEATFYPVRYIAKNKFRAICFRNFDVADLLNEEKVASSGQIIEPILVYRLLPRWSKTLGLKPKGIVIWYENQVIDKALIAGAKSAFPDTKIIGVQIFVPYRNWLNQCPSQSEYDRGFAPHEMLCSSEFLCEMANTNTADIPSRPVASLRSQHVFDVGFREMAEKPTVLVLLPFNISDAVDMVNVVCEAGRHRGNIRFIIRCHPDYSSEDLRSVLRGETWEGLFEFDKLSLNKSLLRASIVISSTSSTLVEAACFGIPVIFLGNQTSLNFNPMEGIESNLVSECYSVEDLAKTIDSHMVGVGDKKINYTKEGANVRDHFFTAMSDKTMNPFLDFRK